MWGCCSFMVKRIEGGLPLLCCGMNGSRLYVSGSKLFCSRVFIKTANFDAYKCKIINLFLLSYIWLSLLHIDLD